MRPPRVAAQQHTTQLVAAQASDAAFASPPLNCSEQRPSALDKAFSLSPALNLLNAPNGGALDADEGCFLKQAQDDPIFHECCATYLSRIALKIYQQG